MELTRVIANPNYAHDGLTGAPFPPHGGLPASPDRRAHPLPQHMMACRPRLTGVLPPPKLTHMMA